MKTVDTVSRVSHWIAIPGIAWCGARDVDGARLVKWGAQSDCPECKRRQAAQVERNRKNRAKINAARKAYDGLMVTPLRDR